MPVDPLIVKHAAYERWQPPLENCGYLRQWQSCARRDASRLFASFLKQIPGRISMLQQLVRVIPGFENWTADYSLDSYCRLGSAFLVLYRPRWLTSEELEFFGDRHVVFPSAPKPAYDEYIKNPPKPEPTLDLVIDDLWASVRVDSGVYAGELLLQANPSLKWELRASAPTHILHQLPVIYTSGKSWAFSPHMNSPSYADLLDNPHAAWTTVMQHYLDRARGVPLVEPSPPVSTIKTAAKGKARM